LGTLALIKGLELGGKVYPERIGPTLGINLEEEGKPELLLIGKGREV